MNQLHIPSFRTVLKGDERVNYIIIMFVNTCLKTSKGCYKTEDPDDIFIDSNK